jgi:N-acetylglutamate synthase-like GNAT family acetyltransferase
MKIEQAKKSEEKNIQHLIIGEYFEPAGIEGGTDNRPDLQNIIEFYHNKNGNFWIMKNEEDEIIGTIGTHEVMYKKQPVGILRRFCIAKKYRDCGLGLSLLKNVEEFCKEKKWEYLMLGIDIRTKRVKKLYTRNNYTEFSQEIPQELIQNNIECYLRKIIK